MYLLFSCSLVATSLFINKPPGFSLLVSLIFLFLMMVIDFCLNLHVSVGVSLVAVMRTETETCIMDVKVCIYIFKAKIESGV